MGTKAAHETIPGIMHTVALVEAYAMERNRSGSYKEGQENK